MTGAGEELQTYCVVCRAPIPPEREARRSTTCGKDCKRRLTKLRREQVDKRSCRHCHRPSTQQQRESFREWRRAVLSAARHGRLKRESPLLETGSDL